ncbi:serpin family protein [Nesterenkonia muleiensis]|uniref:serpin family protein n=1 Tax=Nesterenkonia muleiensis TaxID=2282648 RepID=UPI00130044EA|nr:serpin family protein [Nesterenkonia muleiensis]
MEPNLWLRNSALGAVVLLGSVACGGEQDGDLRSDVEYEPASLAEADAIAQVVAASTEFGAESLAELAQGENLVLSPASITVALAMLAEGASGPAAEELEELLGAEGAERSTAFNALRAAALEYDGDPAVVQEDELPDTPVLHLANQLVLNESATPEEDFLDALAAHFDAGVVTTDFGSQDSKNLLDAWVQEHTGGLIEQSAVQAPDAALVFVLQNAILMAAQWQTQFDPSSTSDRDFTTADGGSVQAEMMQRTLETAYTEHDEAQVIRLPYTDGFAMDVVLPAAGSAPEDFTAEDWAAVDDALAGGDRIPVELALPTLDLETSQELVPLLEQMGYAEVIAGNDFSVIGSAVEISQVAHQAVLTVDEQGTVAAAVTEIAGVTSAPVDPPETVKMTVDRPYTLRIVHQETNWPLFMAVINDPTAG